MFTTGPAKAGPHVLPKPGRYAAEDVVRSNAVARLLSANSRVLRDVAIFIRMWPSPPYPYDEPAFMWTFALFTKYCSTICSGASGFIDAALPLFASAASCFAPILLAT